MGCCVSTSNGDSTRHPNFQLRSQSTHETRAPPPPPASVEEETVKEVLSETPKLKLPPIKNPHHRENDEKNVHAEPPFLDEEIKIKPNGCKNEMIFHEEDIISEQEVSEVCSLSISGTVSTTTFNNDYGDNADEGEVKQRVKRSPAARNRAVPGDFGQGRDRIVGKSPTRRTEQSPDKRNNAGRGGGGGLVRLVQSRESGTNQAGRRVSRPDPNRRDPGRRSRSPATSRSTPIGRSPSARKANGSPGPARVDPLERGGSGVESKWPWPSPSTLNNTAKAPTNESLENPLVSLECFIFL